MREDNCGRLSRNLFLRSFSARFIRKPIPSSIGASGMGGLKNRKRCFGKFLRISGDWMAVATTIKDGDCRNASTIAIGCVPLPLDRAVFFAVTATAISSKLSARSKTFFPGGRAAVFKRISMALSGVLCASSRAFPALFLRSASSSRILTAKVARPEMRRSSSLN